jgi:hypothetical protein
MLGKVCRLSGDGRFRGLEELLQIIQIYKSEAEIIVPRAIAV